MTPYYHHHYHHHHHHVPRIPYVCGVCGNQAIGIRVVPQCMICAKTLCAACNIHGLCANDFARLTPQDQDKIKALSDRTRSFQKKMATTPLLIVLCVMVPMMFIPFSFIFGDGFDFDTIFSFFIPMMFFFPIGFCVVFMAIVGATTSKARKVKAEMDAVVLPYKQSMPALAPQPVPASQQQVATGPYPSGEALVGKICPFCGFSNP
nr:hypothetical protein [Candidatus Sigynarchaeota archaeon]